MVFSCSSSLSYEITRRWCSVRFGFLLVILDVEMAFRKTDWLSIEGGGCFSEQSGFQNQCWSSGASGSEIENETCSCVGMQQLAFYARSYSSAASQTNQVAVSEELQETNPKEMTSGVVFFRAFAG